MVQKLIQLRRSNERADVVHPLFRRPVFAWLGLRPVWGQHTQAEREALRKWVTGKSNLVEIGVAEGSSAIDLREVMSGSGTFWLIDPFHLGRVRGINATKRAAHRVVGKFSNGTLVWIEKFSFEALKGGATRLISSFSVKLQVRQSTQGDSSSLGFGCWNPVSGILFCFSARVGRSNPGHESTQ